jgi:hypothetical protein
MRRIASILIEQMKQGPVLVTVPGLRAGKPYSTSAILVQEILEDGILGQLVTKRESGLWSRRGAEKTAFIPFSCPLNINKSLGEIEFEDS